MVLLIEVKFREVTECMKIDENYMEKLVNTVAKTIVEAFENLSIEDINMYGLGYKNGERNMQEFVENRCRELGIDYTLIFTCHSVDD